MEKEWSGYRRSDFKYIHYCHDRYCGCRHLHGSSKWHLYTGSNQHSLGVNINEQPEIITGPASQTVCAGQSVTFTVNAGVTTGVSYQWRKGGVNIVGATGSSYTIPVTVAADAGSYNVVVSGTCTPPVTSAAATLTIDALPVITGQPVASQAVCEGSPATFTVTATGTSTKLSMEKEWSGHQQERLPIAIPSR